MAAEILPAYWWLIAAGILAALEIIAPGFFLIWLAGAAAITGLLAFVLPGGVILQLVVFAILAVVAVLLGRRLIGPDPVSEDPLLNDRIGRLIGEVVTVVDPIIGGHGRVKIADSPWPAIGPDAAAGARVRVIGMDGTTLRVEPLGAHAASDK